MEVIVAIAIVWWLALVAQQRRERARDAAGDYQMSQGWVARWHHARRGPFPAA